jgi:octaprenyl-diphosphate synthase
MLISDEVGDALEGQQTLDQGNHHEVVGAHKFDHAWPTATLRPGQSDRRRRRRDLPGQGAIFMVKPVAVTREQPVGIVIPLEEKTPERIIDQLTALVANDMAAVNLTILSRTGSDVAMIPEVANHLISSGGKRLRPMLTLASAGLCGYSGEGHIKLAAAIEFMHTATLLHDDVVDESDLRRGKLAARVVWGNEASVLVGDFLLGQAFKMMVEVGSLQCLDVLSSAAAVIAEGEVMQLSAAKDTATSEDDYLAVIRAKTAALFAAACEVGPILAQRPKAEVAACRGFGANLGLAFQLIDDALDYGGTSAKLGKNVGDDFREGKITLPVVLAFRRGTVEERVFWRRALEEGEVADGDLTLALATLKKHRALEDTVERARHYGAMARDALELFAASNWKHALLEAVEFAIERVN